MAFDLKRSYFSRILELPASAGVDIEIEGLVLGSVLQSGLETVAPAVGGGADIIRGFSITDGLDASHSILAAQESAVVPSAAPYTYQVLNPMINGAGSFLILNAVTLAPITPTSISATGLVTFAAGNAGESVIVSYQWLPTVLQVRQLFYQRNVNRSASQFFGQLSVGMGEGQIFLDYYDTSVNYNTPYAGGTGLIVKAGGVVSVGTLAGATVFPGHVIQVPSVDDNYLGLAFNLPQH